MGGKELYRLLVVVCVLLLGTASGIAQSVVPASTSSTVSSTTSSTSSSRNASSGNGVSNNDNNASPFGDTNATKGIQYHKDIPDSVLRQKVFMFHNSPFSPKITEIVNPSLDPTGVQNYDVLDALNGNYYLSTGIIGHPHISLFPSLSDGIRYQLQGDDFVGYAKRLENIFFYQTQTPYSRLAYNSSTNKDYRLQVGHTQDIMPGWNVAFDYTLINPEGVYSNSSAKNNYFDATTNYFSPDARLQAKAGIIWNKYLIGENGGLSDDTYFTQRRQSNRAGIPVVHSSNYSRNNDLHVFGGLSYNLVRQWEKYRTRDSIVAKMEGDSVVGLDTIHITDTITPNKEHILNWGVVGMEAGYDRRKRAYADSTLWQERTMTLFWSNDAYMDHRWHNPIKVTLGIKPRYIIAIVSADSMYSKSWLNPFAQLEVSKNRHILTLFGEMSSVFDHDNDYHLSLSYRYVLDSTRQRFLYVKATAQRQIPDIRMLHDVDTMLRSITSQRYEVGYRNGEMVDVYIRANHLDHNIWYDSNYSVVVGQGDFWLYQASATLRVTHKWLHYDMQQLLQHSSDEVQMPIPLWASKNSLYADLHLFHRALRAQLGFDLHFHTSYYAPDYDPYTGIFYHQDQTKVGNYLWADAFINLQIKRASIYLKGGHFNALWESSPNYFLLPHYPGTRFGVYWGVVWRFFD